MHYRTRRFLSNLISSIVTALIVLISFFSIITIILNIVYIKTEVEGYSMLPTLNSSVTNSNEEGDIIYINRFSDYTNDDIVVAFCKDREKHIIKRLVGCPGDIIEIKDEGENYSLYINEKLLYNKEKTYLEKNNIGSSKLHYDKYLAFINNENNSKNFGVNSKGEKCIKLLNNEYFLLGDNWGNSDDSLTFGTFSKEEIVGKVDLIIPYGEKAQPYILQHIYNLILT